MIQPGDEVFCLSATEHVRTVMAELRRAWADTVFEGFLIDESTALVEPGPFVETVPSHWSVRSLAPDGSGGGRRSNAPDDDQLVTEVMQKMIKQRRESADLYRKGGREELAATEDAEIAVIERFLPKQMSDEEASAAIQAIIAETGASGMKDMGRVMAAAKAQLAGKADMAQVSTAVKQALAR